MIYLDNAATTKIRPEVVEAMQPWLTDEYGNPSGKYDLGFRAKEAIENARQIVANSIHANPEEIIFTSGATEGNNFILDVPRYDVITSPIEHHSVLNVTKHRSYMLKVDKTGMVDLDSVKAIGGYARREAVMSVMAANNEIGTIQPIKEIAAMCEDQGIYFHTDATQMFGHMPIDVRNTPVDFLTASAHKYGGPKGVGFIYVAQRLNKRFKITILSGGQQEGGRRAGTENVAGIVGLGVATRVAHEKMKAETQRVKELRNQMYGWISNNIPEAHINGTADWRKRLTNNLNFRFDGCNGEDIVAYLNEFGIATSSGSACDSESNEPSHVLKAIGLTDEEANSSVRFSLGADLNRKDIEFVCQTLKQGIEVLKR